MIRSIAPCRAFACLEMKRWRQRRLLGHLILACPVCSHWELAEISLLWRLRLGPRCLFPKYYHDSGPAYEPASQNVPL